MQPTQDARAADLGVKWIKDMRWYADNSELNGLRGTAIPDILLFGGIAILPDEEKGLREAIETVKGKFGHKRAPVKWNFKDLRTLYKKQNMDAFYTNMLKESKTWRLEIAEAAKNFDFKIIIAVVESHSIATKTIKGYKPDLSRYAFSNGLMRLGLHVDEIKPKRAQIILDWPDKGDSKPFDTEYASAYNDGHTKEGNVKYHCGKLENLSFTDSAAYVNMHHSTLLQFSDFVLGATREVIECAIGKKPNGFGVDFSKVLASKYRGHPSNIVGRGISIASKNSSFRASIKGYVDRELSI